MFYTVSEVAKRLNISPHTLRFYAKEGLLPFVERDQNGNRIFKGEDFHKLFIIASLKQAGMSIRQIRDFVALSEEGESTIPERLKMMIAQKENVEEQITELTDALDVLKYKIWLYGVKQKGGKDAAREKNVPPHIKKIKERIRRLTDDMEGRYRNAAKSDG